MDFRSRYKYNPKTDMLGKGGFAIVYKAQDTLLSRVVALKFFTHNDSNKNSLIQEISRAISLEHPNLCRYYDANMLESINLHGELEKTEVGVMEYIDSGDLKSFLRHNITYFNKLLIDVLEGLSYLHNSGIIHRDLKPQNILIKSTVLGPIAKITDFGISKHINSGNTNASQLMGTIEYMAPEQFSPAKYGINGRISTNLDLWSFGLMVYELIMGETLFGGKGGHSSAEQIMSNILHDDIVEERAKKIPEPYKQIIQLCIVKDANKRVQSAGELIRLLKAARDNEEETINTIKALRGQTTNSGYSDPGADETKLIDSDDTETRVIHLAGNETMVIEVPQLAHEDTDVTDGNDAESNTRQQNILADDEPTQSITEIPPAVPDTKVKTGQKGKTAQKPKAHTKGEEKDEIPPPHTKHVSGSHVKTAVEADSDDIDIILPASRKSKLLVPLIILAVILTSASVWVYFNKKNGKITGGKTMTDYQYAIRHFGDTTTDFLPRLVKAANGGNDSAKIKLAGYYNTGKHYGDAIKTIDSLALKKNPEALKILGESQYEIGYEHYKKQEYEKSFELFTQSAATNNAQAECMIGTMYYMGQVGVKKDHQQALGWYEKSARLKNDVASYMLGVYYADGDGVKPNKDTAAKYLNWAIKHGVENATVKAASDKLALLNKVTTD